MVAATWSRALESVLGTVGRAWIVVAFASAAAYVVMLLAPRTTARVAVFATFGGAVAAVIALATGQVAYAAPLWIATLVGIFIQAGAGLPPRRRSDFRVARISPGHIG